MEGPLESCEATPNARAGGGSGKSEIERMKKGGSGRLKKTKESLKQLQHQHLAAQHQCCGSKEPSDDHHQQVAAQAPKTCSESPGAAPTSGSPVTDAGSSPSTRPRHQRSRSMGKNTIMTLVGIKKKKNKKEEPSNGVADHNNQGDKEHKDTLGKESKEEQKNLASAAPPAGEVEHAESSTAVINTSSGHRAAADEAADGGFHGSEYDAVSAAAAAASSSSSSSLSVSIDDDKKDTAGGADAEDESDSSSSLSSPVVTSATTAIRRKKLSHSSSNVPEVSDGDPPPSASAAAEETTPPPLRHSSSEKRIKRMSLPLHTKMPPLPPTPIQLHAPPTATTNVAKNESESPGPLSVLGQAKPGRPTADSPAHRSYVSAVSAMHQTRPVRSKRMTMDAASLKSLYAQDPYFQRCAATSGAREQPPETQAVLSVLQTLAENGIAEEDIWDGEPKVFPLLEPFKSELKKAAEVCKSSVINFILPETPLFGGLKVKMFKVNNFQPIMHLVIAITGKLGGAKSMTLRRTSFALTTLAGHQLDPREVLASYGMGSILQMWELKIVVLKRCDSGMHTPVDKKPLPNPQQVIFEQVKTLQSQTADISQRVQHTEAEQKQIESRMEELAREIEKSEREKEEARKAEEVDLQKKARREWRLAVDVGIEMLRNEVEQRDEGRKEKIQNVVKDLRDELDRERAQAQEKEYLFNLTLTGLAGEVELMHSREAEERKRVEGLVAMFREEMEERERERGQREKEMRNEIESAKALLKGGEEAKHIRNELDIAEVVTALKSENDKQRKELVKRMRKEWESERDALIARLRGEWDKEVKGTVQRLRTDWEKERAKEYEAIVKRTREERDKEREKTDEKQRERMERERREVKALVEQESVKAIGEVLEDVEAKMAKLKALLEASDKKIEKQSKALELLDKRVKSSQQSTPSSSPSDTPPPPPPPTLVAEPKPIIKSAVSKRPPLKRDDRSYADLLLAGLQKRFSAIQQIQAEELDETDDNWKYTS